MQSDKEAIVDMHRLQQASPESLSQLLATDRAIIDRLLQCDRTAGGLQRFIFSRLGAFPKDVSPSARALLAMDSSLLQRFARDVGAVRLAKSILNIVDGDQLRAFTAATGPAPRGAALRWHGLTANEPALVEVAPLEEMIEPEGWQCLRAWCQLQAHEIGSRVWLMLPPGPQRSGREAELGGQIVNAMAAEYT